MKLASYRKGGADRYGVEVAGGIADLCEKFADKWPTLHDALKAGGLSELAAAASGAKADTQFSEIEFLPPILEPGKLICIGLNYRSHIEETGRPIPEYPMLFVRYPDSVVGHEQPMLRPKVSERYDFEGELAVVIGRTCRAVSEADALNYVAGYACFNDGSIRDYQNHTTQFTPGKNFHHSGAFGPWLVTSDEIPDPHTLHLTTRLNGEVMQDTETSDLMFNVNQLIAYISTVTPLNPGDVIATGTTGGVGNARKPPLYMKAGDRIEIEIQGLGTLANTIEDER